jgi:hypothetical protein
MDGIGKAKKIVDNRSIQSLTEINICYPQRFSRADWFFADGTRSDKKLPKKSW